MFAHLVADLAQARLPAGLDEAVVAGLGRGEELVDQFQRALGPCHRLVGLAHRLQAERLEAFRAVRARNAEGAVEQAERGLGFALRAVGVARLAQRKRLLDVGEARVVQVEAGAFVVLDLAAHAQRLLEELQRRVEIAERDLDVADVGHHARLPEQVAGIAEVAQRLVVAGERLAVIGKLSVGDPEQVLAARLSRPVAEPAEDRQSVVLRLEHCRVIALRIEVAAEAVEPLRLPHRALRRAREPYRLVGKLGAAHRISLVERLGQHVQRLYPFPDGQRLLQARLELLDGRRQHRRTVSTPGTSATCLSTRWMCSDVPTWSVKRMNA